MKGYIMVFLVATILLLLLPLPALPQKEPNSTVSDAPPTDTNTDNSTPGTPSPEDTGDAFRILCGNQVVTLSAREFLIRTLAFEMDPTYHTEALKAQAVAAYTYYGRRRALQQQNRDEALQGADFAILDNRFPQEYTADALRTRWGDQFPQHYNKLCDAVDAVLGKRMTYEGELIDACYFAISNGCTESASVVWGADIPYLQAVASPGDCLSPSYESTVTMTAAQVKEALLKEQPTLQLPENPTDWFGAPTCSPAGTVTAITVGNSTFTGTALRQALSLRSATFTVAVAQDSFIFTVKGYGHGVGMSQYGADYLARQGYTWSEILQYYYQGVTIS